MSDTPNEKKFMREKVVKPPIDKRRAAGRILCYVLFAAVFGGVAAVSFVASLPTAKKLLGKEQPVTSAPITIERDQDPSGEPTPVETMAETTGEGIRAEDLKDEVDKIVGDAMEKFPWTTKNLTELNDAFRNIYLESEKSIVTVSAVKNDVDWFDNPIETTGQYAGIIIAVNSSEALILTGQSAVAGADSLRVTFGDGSTAAVELKSQDITSKMAVVSAKISDIEEQTVNWMKAVELGNSYSVRTGDMVLAVGSPSGHVHSVKQGLIAYVAKGVQAVDGQTRILYTEFESHADEGTFLLNLSGQLVGWATDTYQSGDNGQTEDKTMAMPISEYKGVLQKLTNGQSAPYFGIRGQDVTSVMMESGIPSGVYITDSIADGPAYNVGIQNGDILTKIKDTEIQTIRDFQNRLEETKTGDTVKVTVKRKSIDEYKEIEYQVTIGAR